MTHANRGTPRVDCVGTSMYTHPFLPQPDTETLRQFVVENPFCQVITASVERGVHCSALVLIPDESCDDFTLLGHLARRNPHADALSYAESALILFAGPHGYVSPSRYRDKPDVPTWNYIAAQARGDLELIDDKTEIKALLRATVDYMERRQDKPWTMDQAPPGRVSALLSGVRGFRISVRKLEGTFKLSQNFSENDRQRVADYFLSSPRASEVELGRMMLERE